MENERKIDVEELKKKVTPTPMTENFQVQEDTLAKIEGHVRGILEILKLDLNDDSLEKTPERVARMYAYELFKGLDWNNFPKITVVANKMKYDQAITISNISFTSLCEHHLVIISGVCHISYLPQDWVLGLSKFNRIVDFFARRPAIQERTTQQILEAIQYVTATDNVAVTIDAFHFCVKARGVRDPSSITRTTALSGSYLEKPELRAEYFMSIPKSHEIRI